MTVVDVAAPTIVLGFGPDTRFVQLRNHLKALGFRIVQTADLREIRQYVVDNDVEMVVLPVEDYTESGFLTCAKIKSALPETPVVLYGPQDAEFERFAHFVGALGYIHELQSTEEIVKALAI